MRFLEEPIKLSDGIWLDNPRDESEVSYFKEYIEYSQKHAHLNKFLIDNTLPIEPKENLYNWTDTKNGFINSIDSKTKPLKQLKSDLLDQDPFSVIARGIVLIRYDDFGFFEYEHEHGKELSQLHKDDSESPIIKEYFDLRQKHGDQFKKILTNTYLITFLHLDRIDHSNFIFYTDSYDREYRHFRIDEKLNTHLGWWARNMQSKDNRFDNELYALNRDPNFSEIIRRSFALYETMEDDDLLKYCAESIKISSSANMKFRLISLVSLIESFIVKQPDANRYHIEDSIKKQFTLKLGLILRERNDDLDMDLTRIRLRELYDQRSNIAHGNFKEFKKASSKSTLTYSKDMDFEDYPYDLCTFAEMCLRNVLMTYLEDKGKMEFIKQN